MVHCITFYCIVMECMFIRGCNLLLGYCTAWHGVPLTCMNGYCIDLYGVVLYGSVCIYIYGVVLYVMVCVVYAYGVFLVVV